MSLRTRAAVMAAMESYLGVRENPKGSNRTRVGEEFGWNGVAWCCQTAWLAMTKAGFAVPKTASCIVMRDNAKRGVAGMKWLPVEQAMPADFFVFATGHHIGMVSWREDAGFDSVEGNWGDACVRVDRNDWSAIGGVIRLPFVDPTPVPLPKPQPFAVPQYVQDPNKLQGGDTGMGVALLQTRLNNLRGVKLYAGQKVWDELKVDGEFGGATGGAVGAFQAAYGIPMNGVFDWLTAGKLKAVEAYAGIHY